MSCSNNPIKIEESNYSGEHKNKKYETLYLNDLKKLILEGYKYLDNDKSFGDKYAKDLEKLENLII